MSATVIIHFNEAGQEVYHVCGDARLFIVDERAPNDRVYEWLDRSSEDLVADILKDSPIGSKNDSRHAAIKAKVEAFIEGKPHHLEPVK